MKLNYTSPRKEDPFRNPSNASRDSSPVPAVPARASVRVETLRKTWNKRGCSTGVGPQARGCRYAFASRAVSRLTCGQGFRCSRTPKPSTKPQDPQSCNPVALLRSSCERERGNPVEGSFPKNWPLPTPEPEVVLHPVSCRRRVR